MYNFEIERDMIVGGYVTVKDVNSHLSPERDVVLLSAYVKQVDGEYMNAQDSKEGEAIDLYLTKLANGEVSFQWRQKDQNPLSMTTIPGNPNLAISGLINFLNLSKPKQDIKQLDI